MPKHARQPEAPNGEAAISSQEDTAARRLGPVERRRLDIDSWEPSLLRALLEAHNRLPPDEA